MRTKDNLIKATLSEEEVEKLKENATMCGLSRSEFMRMLIMGKTPKSKPDLQFWELLECLYDIHKSFKTIAANCSDDEIANDIAQRQFDLQTFILQLQKEFTLPKRSTHGNYKNMGN